MDAQKSCRLCGSPDLEALWSLGETPLANAYRRPDELAQPVFQAPLDVQRCTYCELVQLKHTVSPEALFQDYLYVSSTSPRFVAHCTAYAAHLIERFRLTPRTLVIDVGSNDGILLKPLRARGARVLGIEPALRIAAMAQADGIETIPAFLDVPLARALRAARGPAAIVTANNVFAHVPDLPGFVESVQVLLSENGVFVFEVQYLGDLLRDNLFDIIYHEHLCYYHLTPLVAYFASRGMDLFDVQRLPVHGGSLRVFVQRAGGPQARDERVTNLLAEERAARLQESGTYQTFVTRVERNKEALQDLLRHLRAEQKLIVGYGAPAKATTLLATFGIGAETLSYIVDDDAKMKQGRFMPGVPIPIVPPARLYEDRPDYCLILAWNFAEPIIENHARYAAAGGRFIVPVPEPRLI